MYQGMVQQSLITINLPAFNMKSFRGNGSTTSMGRDFAESARFSGPARTAGICTDTPGAAYRPCQARQTTGCTGGTVRPVTHVDITWIHERTHSVTLISVTEKLYMPPDTRYIYG